MSPVAPAHANCVEIINSIFRDRPNLVMLRVIPVAPRNVLDVSGATTTNQERFLVAGAIFCKFAGRLLLPCALYWMFHVRQESIFRIIFRGTMLGSLYGTYHVFRLSNKSLLVVWKNNTLLCKTS